MEALKRGIQSPVGKGVEGMKKPNHLDSLSPFRVSLRKIEDHGISPDKFKQWKHNLSPFSKKVIEEISHTSPVQKLLHGGEVKMRIPQAETLHIGSLAASLRTKYGKRKRNLLFLDREFEPVDLSINLFQKDWIKLEGEDGLKRDRLDEDEDDVLAPKEKIRKTDYASETAYPVSGESAAPRESEEKCIAAEANLTLKIELVNAHHGRRKSGNKFTETTQYSAITL